MIISFMQELTKEMLMQNYDQRQRHLISPPPPTMGFNDIARANTVENNRRSTATGDEKSLCSPVAGKFLWFPVVTGERKFLSSPDTMGEGESLRSPGVTGERESLHSPSVTGDRKFLFSPDITGERESLRSPSITGERKFLSSPDTTGERESLRSPSVTGERESLRSPVATGEGKSKRLHMFDKVVTPSDVGKLNRLVIPKHHAQKYFPLDANEKDRGLLLTFEDKRGKEWRFRYSYWTSSQSYVFTKGWNGFVREMGLHAGDVVSFHTAADSPNMQRHFYISWQPRGSKAPLICGGQAQIFRPSPFLMSSLQDNDGAAVFSMPTNGGAAVSSLFANGGAAMSSYASFRLEQTQGLLPSVAGHPAAGGERNTAFVQVKPGQRPAGDESYPAQKMSKRVRLFGVTL